MSFSQNLKNKLKSDFGKEIIQRVRFLVENFTKHQILNHDFYIASAFESSFLQSVRFLNENLIACWNMKNSEFKKSHFETFFRRTGIFCIFHALSKAWFWI